MVPSLKNNINLLYRNRGAGSERANVMNLDIQSGDSITMCETCPHIVHTVVDVSKPFINSQYTAICHVIAIFNSFMQL